MRSNQRLNNVHKGVDEKVGSEKGLLDEGGWGRRKDRKGAGKGSEVLIKGKEFTCCGHEDGKEKYKKIEFSKTTARTGR